MKKIKSHIEGYECSLINKEVEITFHYIEDKKRNIKTEGKMEYCNSTEECGVQDKSGGLDWDKCPIRGKTMKQLYDF